MGQLGLNQGKDLIVSSEPSPWGCSLYEMSSSQTFILKLFQSEFVEPV